MQTFGTSIPVLGPNNGYPGRFSRTTDTIIEARPVSPTTANPLYFGQGAVLLGSATGGTWQSLQDFLATATNAQYLQSYFAGICVFNVKVMQPYSALSQTPPAAIATTATGTAAASTMTVASAAGLVLGMSVEGLGIAAGSTVTAISSTTITLSLPLIYSLSSTNVSFSLPATPAVGNYAQGSQGEVLVRSSVIITLTAGIASAAAKGAVYIRTVANAATPGTSVGDFEGAAEVATSALTYGCTIGSATFTTSAATGLAVGQMVTGPGIPANTYIVSGATTSWVFSNAATATIASGAALTAYNTALLGDSTGSPWIQFRTGNVDSNGVVEVLITGRHA